MDQGADVVELHPHRREAAERRMEGEYKENSLKGIEIVRRAKSVICKFNLRTAVTSGFGNPKNGFQQRNENSAFYTMCG